MNILSKYTDDLVEKDGIYFSKKEATISYPSEGNEHCFQIEKDSFWFNHRNDCIITAVKKYSLNNLFFDIGGGNGFVAKGLEDEGIATVLIEPGVQGCINARKKGLKNIVCSTLENASFKKNSIHAIGLFDVVEHIEDDHAFLKSVNDYLVDGGWVFITVPAYNALWSDEDDYAGHYRRYSIKKLEKVLVESGYKIEYSTYIFSILPIPVFLFRALPGKLGISKKNIKEKHLKEHKTNKGLITNILNKIWKFELNKITKGERIPVGGSCFVIARKRSLDN